MVHERDRPVYIHTCLAVYPKFIPFLAKHKGHGSTQGCHLDSNFTWLSIAFKLEV